MTDIAVLWDSANARGDWDVGESDLATCGGLESSVLVCLFTDRLAPAGYVPPDPNDIDLRGFWADTYEPTPTGSWLWLLNRSKITDGRQILLMAQDYCLISLQSLIDAGVAETITVNTFWISRSAGLMGITVVILPPGGQPAQTFTYAWAWEGIV